MIKTEEFFDEIFKKSKENSIILMDETGKILDVNKGFLNAFGYSKKDLTGKNFEMLFTPKDIEHNKPALEVKRSLSNGSSSDNNYLLNKDGVPIWVLGESIMVKNDEGEKSIIKIIQNINTQKKLEGFLIESDEFINTVFDSVQDAAFVILNSELRILRTNKMFLSLFKLKKADVTEIQLLKLKNSFWKTAEIKKQITDILVTKTAMKNVPFKYKNGFVKSKDLLITSKLMENEGMGRTILLVIKVK
jgi:PAS domain S-box-containing protein